MKKAIFCLVVFAASIAASPVSVTYINAGSPVTQDAHGLDVGPYTLTVNSQNVLAMCLDDFYTTGGSWNANITGVSAANLGNTYLGNGNQSVNGVQTSSRQIYLEEAYLYSQLVLPGADRVHLQDAAWTLMDYATGHTSQSASNPIVHNILSGLSDDVKSFDASNYEILSQIGGGRNPEQEFIYATPEPASIGLLGGTLVLLGATGIWLQRRKQEPVRSNV